LSEALLLEALSSHLLRPLLLRKGEAISSSARLERAYDDYHSFLSEAQREAVHARMVRTLTALMGGSKESEEAAAGTASEGDRPRSGLRAAPSIYRREHGRG